MTESQKRKITKMFDDLVNKTFNNHFNCIPVNMMDTPKIYKEIGEVLKGDASLVEQKMAEIVAKYRQN
jgi:hypothetical protein